MLSDLRIHQCSSKETHVYTEAQPDSQSRWFHVRRLSADLRSVSSLDGPHISRWRRWCEVGLILQFCDCLQVVFASARRVESVCLKCVWLIKHFCFLTLEKSCLWMLWTLDTDSTVLPLTWSTCEGWCDLYNISNYMISFHV